MKNLKHNELSVKLMICQSDNNQENYNLIVVFKAL